MKVIVTVTLFALVLCFVVYKTRIVGVSDEGNCVVGVLCLVGVFFFFLNKKFSFLCYKTTLFTYSGCFLTVLDRRQVCKKYCECIKKIFFFLAAGTGSGCVCNVCLGGQQAQIFI